MGPLGYLLLEWSVCGLWVSKDWTLLMGEANLEGGAGTQSMGPRSWGLGPHRPHLPSAVRSTAVLHTRH